MLIPIVEIQNNSDHYQFKTSYELALEHQLEKVLYLTKEVEKGLDQQARDSHWYIANKNFSYNLDALINNLSTLTEYYHGWIVFSHIGTTIHKKTQYLPLKKDEKLNAEIDKIFKNTSIGVLKISKNDQSAFYEACKKAFLQAYDFLLVGKFYEVYVLNNYLKHNMAATGYAPKAIVADKQISIPYLYIDKPNDRLLNSSVFKCLFDHELDDNGKIINTKDDYFINIINATVRPVCSVASYKVYNINGIDYLKNGSSVGLSMESIVEMAHELVLNIVKVFIDSSKGNVTLEKKLSRLIDEIKIRSPKTLNKLIIC